MQNFCRLDDDADPSEPDKPQSLRWRTEVEGYPPSALMVASPYDLDVHYAKKRQTTWIGYKVHLTNSCESGQPNLITHVETTTAPMVDRDVLADVHAALKGKDLRPERHLVDAGYIDADGLVASARDHGITLVGPPPANNQWQARTEGALAIEKFNLDWDRQIATCPAGQTSESWIPDTNGGHDNVRIRFSLTHCKASPLKARCTRSNRRVLQKAGVDFVACDMPTANRLTVGILAMVAEEERRAISKRTKDALAAAKARGTKLGGDRGKLHLVRDAGRAAGIAVRQARASGRAVDLAPIIAELRAGGSTTLAALAEGLNARGIPASRGGVWSPMQVSRVLKQTAA